MEEARQALLEAKARVAHSPSALNLASLEEARAHLDDHLDNLLYESELLDMGGSHGPWCLGYNRSCGCATSS